MAWNDFYIIGTGVGSNLNAGSTSSGTAIYTSASGNWASNVFTPTDGSTPASSVNVGDWCSIYPTGNTTTPYIAQVTTVAAGQNGAITLSSTLLFGTAPGTLTGTANLIDGGAWADLGMLASGVALNTGTVTQSTRVNIKAATYANTSTTRTFHMAGAATTPLWWRGYQTTPGDQDSNNTATAGTNIPSITFTTGQFAVTGIYQSFSSLDVSGASTSAAGLVDITVGGGLFYRFRATNTVANTNGIALNSGASTNTFVSCAFKSTSSSSNIVGCQDDCFLGCTFTCSNTGGGGTGTGLLVSAGHATIHNCVFDSCVGDGIKLNTTEGAVRNCSFYNCGGNGITCASTPGTSGEVLIANNYFSTITTAAKAGINNTSGTNTFMIRCVANAFFNCTANYSGLQETFVIFDNGTLASEAFRNPSGHDFMILSPGYSLGFPGGFENTALYQGTLDVGAVQHQSGGLGQIMRVWGQNLVVGN